MYFHSSWKLHACGCRVESQVKAVLHTSMNSWIFWGRFFQLLLVMTLECKRNGPCRCCKSQQPAQQTDTWWFWFTTADPHGGVWSDRAELVMGSKLDVSGLFNLLWHVWVSTHTHEWRILRDLYYLGWAGLGCSAQVGSFVGWKMCMYCEGATAVVFVMFTFGRLCA